MGGGVAGIAAALRLAEHGLAVTLLETRQVLGGRATSFNDPRTHTPLDNCQHVLLGCCTNLLDLYRRLGVADRITWAQRLHFVDKQGRVDVLAANDLPAPLHLSASMLGFKTLGWSEKIAIGRAMTKIWRMGKTGRRQCDDMTFAQWLHQQKQPPRAIERFWSVIAISACNLSVDRLGAEPALQVFQEGFLAHRRAYEMGVSDVPLARLYDRAAPIIEQSGGRVVLGASVRGIEFDGQHITGVRTADGALHTADHYISALPFDRLAAVAPENLVAADARLQSLDRFKVSPILGIHLWFSRPVTDRPHLIFVDSPLQWIFNKGCGPWAVGLGQEEREPETGHGEPATAQYLHAVVSAADEWVGLPGERIVELALEELAAYCPAVKDTPLVRGRAIKEKRATFAAEPGIAAYRPEARGAVGNLLLAGDWCATGWPSTMEGAARSGYAAAGAVLDRDLLIEDLPFSPLYRWLSKGA